uniref:Transmembrane protein 14 n=1 Tax=Polytomella parva TaxID=51329 RepID=A0A7S0YNV4_9CHLO|eukprot:CAMPEP_0175057536 /NCGR_PEP_ID=MMETSP0052_2-20121109/11316_1 /TAXON_ID=51329 ORGANISM="Polytomella parva, Strain SAG 63-3" /NCGR_SAMPLE_ID=MMETSP0052_2 /ASSEMBLY_ACC=CAM_ASM_000194 /LENGTH=109 /DNA_ID=CAMNT_0016322755 /DNA_START=24 /DNA_END=353 /DNA_ORIENTATION=-
MAPTGQAHLDITLALLTSVGGAMGYFKKNSVPSLIGGIGFGVAYGTTAYLIQNVDAVLGHQVGCVTSVALAASMGARFLKTKKVFPAGVVAGAGVLGLAYHIKKYQEWA